MRPNQQHQRPLRTYFLILFMVLLLISSSLALLVVGLISHWFFPQAHHGELALGVFALMLMIGGGLMWYGASHLTQPIAAINAAVKQIAQGNFDVRIKRRPYPKDQTPFHNELDELSKNVNHMAAELKAADQVRQTFISNLSHELKTPIAAIAGLAELLMDAQTDAVTKQRLLQLLKSESERLNRLCEGILDLSRLDYGQYETEQVRIDEQLRHATILLTEKWTDKAIQVTWTGEVTLLTTVADLTMLIWTNLLDNAIKYSGQQVDLAISCQSQAQGVQVTISDKGKGMTTEQQARIFDQFYQADTAHQVSGYGLGLALVKKIVQYLDGHIEVHSQLGQGTTVQIVLPDKM